MLCADLDLIPWLGGGELDAGGEMGFLSMPASRVSALAMRAADARVRPSLGPVSAIPFLSRRNNYFPERGELFFRSINTGNNDDDD